MAAVRDLERADLCLLLKDQVALDPAPFLMEREEAWARATKRAKRKSARGAQRATSSPTFAVTGDESTQPSGVLTEEHRRGVLATLKLR